MTMVIVLVVVVFFLISTLDGLYFCWWFVKNHPEHSYHKKGWFEKTKFYLWVIWRVNKGRIQKLWEDVCLFIPKMARRRAFFLKNALDREFVPDDETDQSLSMDDEGMEYLSPEEQKDYRDDLIKRRQRACKKS